MVIVMKKILQRISIFAVVSVLIFTTIVSTIADTVYVYYGYKYTLINNYSVSISGRTDDITSLMIPNLIFDRNVVEISNRAFIDDTELSSVDFSQAKNLSYIGMFAFKGCSSLSGKLVLPYNITFIDSAAFQACTSLDSVVINANINEIPSQMFYRCDSLNNVVINSDIEKIGSFAFADCPSLTYIEIPRSVNYIANSAFINDEITLGVYYNSYAHTFAVDKSIDYIILDPENIPTESPTVPVPTEQSTESIVEKPTTPATEASTDAVIEEPTQADGYYLGDVNGDGVVDIIDATLIQRYSAKLLIDVEYEISHGDVDENNSVDDIDATLIRRYLASIDIYYPVGEWKGK